MKYKIVLAAVCICSSAAFAQNLTPIAIPDGSGGQAVTVCDVKMKSLKKQKSFCSEYQLDVVQVETSRSPLFECDCSHFGIVGPRGP